MQINKYLLTYLLTYLHQAVGLCSHCMHGTSSQSGAMPPLDTKLLV